MTRRQFAAGALRRLQNEFISKTPTYRETMAEWLDIAEPAEVRRAWRKEWGPMPDWAKASKTEAAPTDIQQIIAELGGPTRAAAQLGIPYHTVQKWWTGPAENGRTPPAWLAPILRDAIAWRAKA